MKTITYRWADHDHDREFMLVRVPGTNDAPYTFGESPRSLAVQVGAFHLAVVPVTQALWSHVFNSNPSLHVGPDLPVENISWDQLTRPGGFLERLNASPVAGVLRAQVDRPMAFRLPSETEWEYAARGGPHWRDGYQLSGSDDPDAVAWHHRRHGDHTQPVGQKAPNQLGIFDMSGNVWEWCHDTFTRDLQTIPVDGSPYVGGGDDRVLRGGCFHNGAEHCTVAKRYEIARDYRDGCIGVRLVYGPSWRTAPE